MGNLGVLVKKYLQTSIRVFAAAGIALWAVGAATAQPAMAVEAGTANTLKISPVRSDIEVEKGKSHTVEVTVSNLTDADMVVRAIANDFIAGDERGTPALILDADKYAPTHSLKRFMKPISDVKIPANKAKTIDVTITVPKDAQSGGYFGAVRFAPTDPTDGGQVNLNASAASIILLSVPGPATEKLTMTDFAVQQGGKTGTFFQSANDLQATVRFESKSSVQVAPFGKISVKQGDKVVYEYDFNPENPREMVLPDSARRWDIPLKSIDSFGHYTVHATMTYGKANQTIETSTSFWVVPWIVIAIAVGAVLLLVGAVIFVIFAIRRRRRKVQLGHHGRRRY